MKKLFALLLVAAMLVSLVSCSANNSNSKEAFDTSKEAFKETTQAYILVNEFSMDIYEAWRLGINEKSDYNDDYELDDFASELNVDSSSIKEAIASLLKKDSYQSGDWKTLQYFYSSFFSACVSVVSEAYIVNGTANKIENLLKSAMENMKTLDDQYSDYTHYPYLKSYFTNTLAFFDFCKDPEGSFEQVVETFNQYRNNARTYFFELNYVFENNINGMDSFINKNEEETGSSTGNETIVY
ncbi:MAG: hypothetical protein IKV40_04750 [Clostridia bacterium]|nr:hypothetical protein [Clostridia bacterium]